MRVVLVYPRVHKFHSRIFKIVSSLEKRGHAVTVLSIAFNKDLLKKERIGSVSQVYRVGFASKSRYLQLLNFCALYLKCLVTCFRSGVKMIWLNSVGVLPISLIGKMARLQVVYAPHELETERSSATGGLKKKMSKLLESSFIKICDHVVVVGDAIAEWYRGAYGLKAVKVLRNIPSSFTEVSSSSNYLREKFQIPDDKVVYIYQGILNKGRGLEVSIEAFKGNLGSHLVIMGFGPLEESVKQASLTHENIHFHEPVPSDQLVATAGGANVGLCLIENTCLSYYYSLPNKLFEYLNAELVILGSNFPEISGIIDVHKVGWTIEPTSSDVAAIIATIDRGTIKDKRANIKQLKQDISWEKDFAGLDFMN